MLQIDVCPFASDALEDAMRLAQTKALNSYTFSDCLNFLNYVWSDIYSQICMIDSGYYSKTVQLTSELTKIPRFVKSSIMVYAAQSQTDHNRIIYRQSGPSDQMSARTYRISGTDLWCPDASRTKIFLEYCPQPPQIFFTHHNRDPKILKEHDTKRNDLYNLYKLIGYIGDEAVDFTDVTVDISMIDKWEIRHRVDIDNVEDITDLLTKDSDPETGKWELKYISCDYPYIFCSYQNSITGEWHSGFFNKEREWTDYNPFEWTGRNDNVEYIDCKYNDKTGLGVIVKDWNDIETKMINIDNIPKQINSIIYIKNSFEYKTQDGNVVTFEPGYWFNRFANDTNYEKVAIVTDYPSDADTNDVVLINNELKRYENGAWTTIDKTSITSYGIYETEPKIKELGWTPDTKLVYPAPEVYRYLVARLAEKFATLNESSIMGVQSELTDARFAFQAFLKKDKSAWERMRNVNPATMGDWL